MPQQVTASASRDLHVVERVLQGDAEVYRLLIERYIDDALAYAYAMLGNADTARSIVQEVFQSAFKTLEEIEDRGNFRTFLLRLLRRRIRMPAEGITAHGLDEEAQRELLAFTNGEAVGVDRLSDAILSLEYEYRDAWVLHYVTQQTMEDIAAIAGVPVANAEERTRGAIEHLTGAESAGPAPSPPSEVDEELTPPALDV